MRWYFRVGDRTQGPIAARRMRRFAAEGKLRPDHMVSSDERHWFRADQVFEFGADEGPPTVDEAGVLSAAPPARAGAGLALKLLVTAATVIGLLVVARLLLAS